MPIGNSAASASFRVATPEPGPLPRDIVAFINLQCSYGDHKKEQRSLAKLQKFGRKLLEALQSQAFSVCQDLLMGVEKLRPPTAIGKFCWMAITNSVHAQ